MSRLRFSFSRPTLAGLVLLLAALPLPAAEHRIDVGFGLFSPQDLEIQVGDTVRWVGIGGLHNVVADDASFTSGPPVPAPWSFARTFDQPGEVGYYCAPHGAPGGVGMSGRIRVVGNTPTVFRINEGLNGAWYNPSTGGQGWFVDVAPELDQLFFAAWFTWNVAGGEHDWFTAQGRYEGDRAIVPLVRTRGGRFDASDPVTFEAAGEVEFIFHSCDRAQLRYRVDETGQQGELPLHRLTPVPERCEQAQE